MKNEIETLTNEYTDWLVENIDREYVENQDCSADAILYESLEGGQLTLNEDQKEWLCDFINRWEKAYL
jgi:spore coat protein CotH